MRKTNPNITVVVPVFNEEKTLIEFYQRTTAALSQTPFTLFFVDDGSQDGSWAIIEQLVEKDARVKGLGFSRNFGHQAALTAGLKQGKGDALVIIDADLQDPPELIPEMVRKWQEGYDVIYGVRMERKGESIFKKATASLFYRILRKVGNIDLPLEAGDFRLLSRDAVQALNQIPERIRFMRGLTSWVGFRQVGIPYVRDPRFAGETKYSLIRMIRLAFDGITSFSHAPLQFATGLGMLATLVSIVLAIYSVVIRLANPGVVRGWTSLMILMVFLGGVQLLMIGLIGEYVGRIYEEVKRRPLYLIRRTAGLKPEALKMAEVDES